MWVEPFHSKQPGQTVYHTNNICEVGASIPEEDRIFGTAGLELCKQCARM